MTIDRAELLARFANPGTLDREDRARLRERERTAAGAINAGKDPRRYWDDESLSRLFTPEELELLDAAVAEHDRDRERRGNARAMREVLQKETAKVERELHAYTRAVIEAEARKRLGWPATGLPRVDTGGTADTRPPRDPQKADK